MTRRAPAIVLLLVATSCGAARKDAAGDAERGLETALAVTDALRDGFVTWDRDRQAAIVAAATSEEAGRAELARYRQRRSGAEAALAAAYHAISMATSGLFLYRGGHLGEEALADLLIKVGEAVRALVKTLDDVRGGSP